MHRFEVFSGYQQFYVADINLSPPAPETWTDKHVSQRHNTMKNITALRPAGELTARIISCGLGEIASEESNAPDFEVRTRIEVPSGKIGVFGWPWELKDCYEVPPDLYQIVFKGYQIDKVVEQEDYYVVRVELPRN